MAERSSPLPPNPSSNNPLPRAPRAEAAGAARRRRLPSVLPLPCPLCTPPRPVPLPLVPPVRRASGGAGRDRAPPGAGARLGSRSAAGRGGRGTRSRSPPSVPRRGGGQGRGGGQPRPPGGCWDLEEGPAAVYGRGGREAVGPAVAARARRMGGTWLAWASPAPAPPSSFPQPPSSARGLQTRQSSSARRIQARKSGSLIEPAFPLTQPQPRLIRSTEGKEAN